jgi:putative tricarboxylic transport membrane protein
VSKKDLLSGLFILGFALFVIQEAMGLPYYYEHGPGPGFFPLWIGVGISVLALQHLGLTVFHRDGEKKAKKVKWSKSARALGLWVSILVMIGLMGRLGFILSFVLFTAFILRFMEGKTLWSAIGVSLGTVLTFYLVFIYALSLRLPFGPWGF